MGRSRGELTSKIHAVVDGNGLPVRLALSPGEAHDVRLAGKLLSRLKSGSMLLADRGYDADWIRELAMMKGAWANIPPKTNRSDPICFSPNLYRDRNQVERFFNRIKQCRRGATRYDRRAANYLAFVQLASIRLWLRLYESASEFRRQAKGSGTRWSQLGNVQSVLRLDGLVSNTTDSLGRLHNLLCDTKLPELQLLMVQAHSEKTAFNPGRGRPCRRNELF